MSELCGFILVDKPRGPSSHEITTYVKKLFGVRKAGHAGTLDPKVSGVMIIALNKACKLLRFLSKTNKTYVGVLKIKNPPTNISAVQKIFDKFIGDVIQTPPLHSAVAKRPRTRTIFSFDAKEMRGRYVLFIVNVQSGTYIRNLCKDVGKYFGGGYMAELRRVSVENFTEHDCIKLPKLYDYLYEYKDKSKTNRLIKSSNQIIKLPILKIDSRVKDIICRGLPLAVSGVASIETEFAVGDYVSLVSDDELIAVGIANINSKNLLYEDKKTVVVKVKIVLI